VKHISQTTKTEAFASVFVVGVVDRTKICGYPQSPTTAPCVIWGDIGDFCSPEMSRAKGAGAISPSQPGR